VVDDSDADSDIEFDFEDEAFKAQHTVFKLAVFYSITQKCICGLIKVK